MRKTNVERISMSKYCLVSFANSLLAKSCFIRLRRRIQTIDFISFRELPELFFGVIDSMSFHFLIKFITNRHGKLIFNVISLDFIQL